MNTAILNKWNLWTRLNEVKVVFVTPAQRRGKAYRDVDLKTEDRILMANGKRIKTVADFKELYESLPVGEELKMGLRRGEEMRMASFQKSQGPLSLRSGEQGLLERQGPLEERG